MELNTNKLKNNVRLYAFPKLDNNNIKTNKRV